MTTIAAENLKQIRQPFEVYAGITARQNISLTYSVSGAKTEDTNLSSALATSVWDMRNFTDFQGEGFVLDGSCELYDSSVAASLDDGKIGIRSNIGGSFTVNVSSGSTINALTIAITSGTGTVAATVGGVSKTYDARRIVVVPVNNTAATLVFTSDNADERIEVASIVAGINLDFDNENLVSVNLDLRSDLSIINPSWEISSIEIQAYWPTDISTAIANIADDVPIYYYSGYSGDYSDVRNFYLSEPATMTNNLLTLRGEDMSHKLEDAKNIAIRRLDSTAGTGWKTLYNYFVSIIKNSGIKATTESAPSTSSASTGYSMVLQDASPRDYVADIMNQAHTGTFWPTFVDAGIPTITRTKPSPKWDIYEEDCGEVTHEIARNVSKITVDDMSDYGVENTGVRSNSWTVIQKDIKIQSGVPISKSFSDVWFWTYSVAYAKNKKFDYALLNSVKWTPNKTTTKKKTTKKVNGKKKTVTTWLYRPTLYGKKLTVTVNKRAVATSRAGYTATVTPLAIGKIYQSTTILYPNYSGLFNRSNEGGSFTWKGNPKMQPRDVVNFHRLDGSVDVITIENIQLTHSGGGTVATISYKNGIV